MAVDKSGFLALPAELRLHIYELVWSPPRSVQVRHPHKPSCSESRSPGPPEPAKALLQVCRLIRIEALPIYYCNTDFELPNALNEPLLRSWLDAIGPPAVANLRNMTLRCTSRCAMYGLQPDTDYCMREARIDFDMAPATTTAMLGMKTPAAPAFCSNRVASCMVETTRAFLDASCFVGTDAKTGQAIVTQDAIVEIWRALKRPHGDDGGT